ncbi:hypothetical protein AT268_32135 [Bacillus cereus]|uniref:Uncharacterized protein n=1 Tax=Bacillus cereus TaxID=1396 RepID=A0A9X0MJW4_BACCE|nr:MULTISPECIES: hypothetical protein [Bacillus cereus group]KXY51151.1 hypothetical protein AT268_32135 [Bacillus cereus]MDX5808466.1 hypothetical protein [Bacillus cereus group sp. BfR-BA-02730]
MKKVQGFKYTIEGFAIPKDFAFGVLALNNAKSSRPGTIANIETHEGTNLLTVVSYVEVDDTINELVGTITDKESIEIVDVELHDFAEKVQKTIEDMEDADTSYHVSLASF